MCAQMGENLAQLMFSVMMTGYLFRNAEVGLSAELSSVTTCDLILISIVSSQRYPHSVGLLCAISHGSLQERLARPYTFFLHESSLNLPASLNWLSVDVIFLISSHYDFGWAVSLGAQPKSWDPPSSWWRSWWQSICFRGTGKECPGVQDVHLLA